MPSGHVKHSYGLRFARAAMRFVAGLLVGGGLLLYGQMVVVEHMCAQVKDTFFLWREIGKATYFLQSHEVQAALTLHSIDEVYWVHTKKVAFALMILGGCLLFASGFVRKRKRRRTG